MKRYFIIGFFFFTLNSHALNFNPMKWLAKKEGKRMVTVVNDINELINVFPEETEELQDAVYYSVEINGVCVNPKEIRVIPIYNNRCTISIRSKNRFHDHLKNAPPKIKKMARGLTSWMDTYYSFVCTVPSDADTIHLALPVLNGCQLLKEGRPTRLSYKWPFGIQIWLHQAIDCD